MSLENNSNLTPATLYGKGDNGNVSMQVSPTGIILGGDLNTASPITATISQAGIITDNVNGFNILSSLNMNNQNITNLNTITPDASTNKINMTASNGFYFNVDTANTGDGVIYGSAHQIEIEDSSSIVGDQYLLFANGSGHNKDVRLDTDLTYNATTNTIACSNFTGLASQATAITITETLEQNATYYPTFVNDFGNDKSVRMDNSLTYNPFLNTLTVLNLEGNASSSTTAITATNADKAYIQTTIDSITHYLLFSPNALDGYATINKNQNTLSCNPITGTITATTFSGTATNANNVLFTSDTTTVTVCPVPFVRSTGTGLKPLFIDDSAPTFTYAPSVGQLSCASVRANTFISGTSTDLTLTNATLGNKINFNTSTSPNVLCCQMDGTGIVMASGKILTGLCSTTGLVFLQTLTGTITGSATATTYTLPAIFNTTYKNYKIHFTFGNNSFSAYPSISLNGLSGLNAPTTGDLYGYDMISGALSAINLSNQVLATTPLQLTGACLPNIQVEFDVFNVGYTTSQSNNIVRIVSNSVYNNPGVKGIRNITAMITQNSASTITGLSFSSILGAGNNPTWTAKIYGFQ